MTHTVPEPHASAAHCSWCGESLGADEEELDRCVQCVDCDATFHARCRSRSLRCPACLSDTPCGPFDQASLGLPIEFFPVLAGRATVRARRAPIGPLPLGILVASFVAVLGMSAWRVTRLDAAVDESDPFADGAGPRERVGQLDEILSPMKLLTPSIPSDSAAEKEPALIEAIEERSLQETRKAIERGDPVVEALALLPGLEHDLYNEGAYALLKLLLEHGACKDATIGPRRDSLLHSAVRRGDLSGVRMLIEAGVPLGSSNRDGQTILHAAIAEGQSEVAIFLIRQLADHAPEVLVKGEQLAQHTALHLAALKGLHIEVESLLDELVRIGGEIAPVSSSGKNPLQCAVTNERDDLATVTALCSAYAKHKPHLLAPKYLDASSPREIAEALGRHDFVLALDTHR